MFSKFCGLVAALALMVFVTVAGSVSLAHAEENECPPNSPCGGSMPKDPEPAPEPKPQEPAPAQPKPQAPAPAQPKPAPPAPKPQAPKPAAPKPVAPKPAAPKAPAPKPVAPKPVAPKPVAPKAAPKPAPPVEEIVTEDACPEVPVAPVDPGVSAAGLGNNPAPQDEGFCPPWWLMVLIGGAAGAGITKLLGRKNTSEIESVEGTESETTPEPVEAGTDDSRNSL